MRRNRGLALVAAAAAVSLAAAGAALATLTTSTATATARVVRVTEREYRITLTPTSLRAGRVTFVVHNAGRVAHALAVSGPGLRTTKTPLVKPGATRSLTVKLGGGTFRLWCPIPGHAADGMKASLKVRGAPAPAPIPTVTTGGTTTDPYP
jgi:plastocyanin